MTSFSYTMKPGASSYTYPSGSISSAEPTNSGSSGNPSTSFAKPPPPSLRPPPNTTFLFRIDQLSPNFNSLSAQFYPQTGHWRPPFYWNAYQRREGDLYRWSNGVITNVASNTPLGDEYACATVFTQSPSTQHFLVVEFDAETQNVSQHGDWHTLGFNHVSSGVGDTEYSELDLRDHTAEDHLVAPGPNGMQAWETELFTSQYRFNAQVDDDAGESAGLIGKLTLLLALVAFSRPSQHIHSVLTQHVRPGQWVPLNTAEHGRTRYRGMVVTIWLDPNSNTTTNTLRRMEKGHYGAFFR